MVRNSILLYRPPGGGKTFGAEVTAAEFRLNYHHVSLPQVESMGRHGETGANIRAEFRDSSSRQPVLPFLDEINSLGSRRQATGGNGDPRGSRREFNNVPAVWRAAVRAPHAGHERGQVEGLVDRAAGLWRSWRAVRSKRPSCGKP
jgi:ATPase family protein associated with various cellular activities (AAA)